MNKKAKTILMIIAAIVVIIALFIPYNEGEKEPIMLTEFSCSDASENQENDTALTKLSCKQYHEITKQDEKSVILIARPTCGYCVKYVPVLEEIVKEYGITINYFNTDALTEEEVTDFYNSSSLFTSKKFGTPTLIIVKNKEVVEYNIGYMEKDATINWLKEMEIISNEG